jgi:hypothetical protein
MCTSGASSVLDNVLCCAAQSDDTRENDDDVEDGEDADDEEEEFDDNKVETEEPGSGDSSGEPCESLAFDRVNGGCAGV